MTSCIEKGRGPHLNATISTRTSMSSHLLVLVRVSRYNSSVLLIWFTEGAAKEQFQNRQEAVEGERRQKDMLIGNAEKLVTLWTMVLTRKAGGKTLKGMGQASLSAIASSIPASATAIRFNLACTYEDGDVLMQQNEMVTDDAPIFVIREGVVKIVVDGKEVARREKTFVGESAVTGGRRSASVVASG